MTDMHMDVSYISMQSNFKNSSPMIFDQLSCKILNIKLKFGMLDWHCVRIEI
jgi:hypothetical protein